MEHENTPVFWDSVDIFFQPGMRELLNIVNTQNIDITGPAVTIFKRMMNLITEKTTSTFNQLLMGSDLTVQIGSQIRHHPTKGGQYRATDEFKALRMKFQLQDDMKEDMIITAATPFQHGTI